MPRGGRPSPVGAVARHEVGGRGAGREQTAPDLDGTEGRLGPTVGDADDHAGGPRRRQRGLGRRGASGRRAAGGRPAGGRARGWRTAPSSSVAAAQAENRPRPTSMGPRAAWARPSEAQTTTPAAHDAASAGSADACRAVSADGPPVVGPPPVVWPPAGGLAAASGSIHTRASTRRTPSTNWITSGTTTPGGAATGDQATRGRSTVRSIAASLSAPASSADVP